MTTTMITTSAIREELARLKPMIDEASADFDRASVGGDERWVARCRQHLVELETKRSDLEAALRGAQRFERERTDLKLLEAKRAAIATANAALDDLASQAESLSNLFDQLANGIRRIHETEDRIPAAVARFKTRETENVLTQVSRLVGYLQIEDVLERHPLSDLGEMTRLRVERARGLIDRIVALPPEE